MVFAGNDDGTVSAMGSSDGRPLWNQVAGVPEGRTELERMADVDGPVVLEDTTVYATSFKNETIAIDGPSGRPLWTQDHGGAGGVGVAPGSVLVSDRRDTVWALDKSSGNSLWSTRPSRADR